MGYTSRAIGFSSGLGPGLGLAFSPGLFPFSLSNPLEKPLGCCQLLLLSCLQLRRNCTLSLVRFRSDVPLWMFPASPSCKNSIAVVLPVGQVSSRSYATTSLRCCYCD